MSFNADYVKAEGKLYTRNALAASNDDDPE